MVVVKNVIKNPNNILEVVFSNGAVQLFNYEMVAISGVFHNERELKAERFTKKYDGAVQSYMDNRTTIVDTGNQNGVFHNVFVLGETVTAYKIIDGETVQTYDWTGHYETVEKLISETVRSSGHEKYTFYVIIEDEKNVAYNKAQDATQKIYDFPNYEKSSIHNNNLFQTLSDYFIANKNVYFSGVLLDGSNSLHFRLLAEHINGNEYRQDYHVLSAYHNGTNDRTTYNGLHRGAYDKDIESAGLEIIRRTEGIIKNGTL